MIRINSVEFFWKNIELKMNANYRNKEYFQDFDKNILITHLDNGRSLIYINKMIYFYNGKVVITPGEFDILKHDKYFGELVGKDISYNAITDIFYIGELQIKEENKRNKLDDIIYRLKEGEYGDIDKSIHWFLDVFPYIKCASFYCRDVSMPEENKKFFPNYGGRCIELLSDKKIIIDNVPIEQSGVRFEMDRLKEENLRKVMTTNGIPSNPFINHRSYEKEKDPSQKDIIDSWGGN